MEKCTVLSNRRDVLHLIKNSNSHHSMQKSGASKKNFIISTMSGQFQPELYVFQIVIEVMQTKFKRQQICL